MVDECPFRIRVEYSHQSNKWEAVIKLLKMRHTCIDAVAHDNDEILGIGRIRNTNLTISRHSQSTVMRTSLCNAISGTINQAPKAFTQSCVLENIVYMTEQQSAKFLNEERRGTKYDHINSFSLLPSVFQSLQKLDPGACITS